jgi:PAS domain S-box-containing protein
MAKKSSPSVDSQSERYKAFIQNSSEGIWCFELPEPIATSLPVEKQIEHIFADARLTEANLATAHMYGFQSVKQLLGQPLSNFMPADDPENIAYLTAFIENNYNLSGVESHEIDNKGQDRYFRNSLVGTVKDGMIQGAWGTQQDVTQQRQAMEALARSEERMRQQNSYLEALHRTALKATRNLRHHNQLLKTILAQAGKVCGTKDGYIYLRTNDAETMEVQVAMGIFESHIGRTIEKGVGVAGNVWKTGMPITVKDYDTWKQRKPGFPTGLFSAGVGVPMITGEGVIGVIALCHTDPTKRFTEDEVTALSRLADLASIILHNAHLFQELQESEARFRHLSDTAPVMIWLSDTDGDLIYLNQPWLEFTGRSKRKSFSTAWADAVHPDDHARSLAAYNHSVKTRTPFTMEYRLRRHDGTYRWVLDKGIPRFSPTGEYQGFTGSCTDIDDLKHASDLAIANTKLKTQKSQLLTLNKAKDDFIALASHQLRTPATAVKQYTSLILDGFAGPIEGKQREYLQTAFTSNERQLRIIQDLLKTAQIDSSRYILDKKRQDIMPIIAAAIEEMAVPIELKHQKVILKGLESAHVEVDANEIKLVFVNLLENASKYSYDKGEIAIEVSEQNACLEIAVIDKGVGIDKQHKQRVFDKFTRIDNDLSDTVTGTGLGLYWVKRIVGLHGGSIQLKSKLKQGSAFTIKLPL